MARVQKRRPRRGKRAIAETDHAPPGVHRQRRVRSRGRHKARATSPFAPPEPRSIWTRWRRSHPRTAMRHHGASDSQIRFESGQAAWDTEYLADRHITTSRAVLLRQSMMRSSYLNG